MTVTSPLPQQGLTPGPGQELWSMQTDATVYLEIEGKTRYGDSIGKEFKVGPNRKGYEFIMKTADRIDCQRAVVDPKLDPFRNGTFIRVDVNQQDDPNTASDQALTDVEILELLDLPTARLSAAIEPLGEVPLRRVHETAVAMDVASSKLAILEDLIKERYAKGAGQPSLENETGERLP